MGSKEYLKIIVKLRTLDIRYQSNVSEEDLLIVKSFLLLLRKEGLILGLEANSSDINYKRHIQKCVDSSANDVLKSLYSNYLKSICERIRKLYIEDLFTTYLKISEDFIQQYAEELFDKQIQMSFTSKLALGSDSMQPQELTTILNSFCNTLNTNSYYNPFAGLASLALKLPRHISYFGEEYNEKTWLLGKLRMLVYSCPPNFKFQLVDSIENWTFRSDKQYDYISFNPPFNIKLDKSYLSFLNNTPFGYLGNANSLIISETFDLLKPEGTMAFICPSGFLFSSSKQDKALKKHLAQNGYIKKIIALPERILSFTALSVNIVVLVKSQSKYSEIEFVDATQLVNKEDNKLHTIKLLETLDLISAESSKLKRKVSIDELVSNDYNLSVSRYVYEDLGISDEEKENLVEFKDLVFPITKKKTEVIEGKFVRIRDLASYPIEVVKSFEDLHETELKSYANKLETNALLLATTWKSLKPTLFEGDDSKVYYDYQSIFACRINEKKVDKEYFILELSKDYVQKQLDQKRSGSVQSRITRKDLLQIKIIIPSLELQKKRKYSYQESVIIDHQTRVKELMLEYGIDVADENSFLRHKIAGTLKNLRGSFSKLKSIIEQQILSELPELYSYKANPKLNSNFLDYLNRMDRDLNSIHNAVKAVGVELNLQDIKLESISFVQFIIDYTEGIKNRTARQFQIKTEVDKEMLKEHKIKEVIVQGDRDLLRQAFNNIIENAERHAFNDLNLTENRIELELLYDFDNLEVQLDFTNTGKPFPENYSFEAFTRKGGNAGGNAGNGIGGWFISEVMKKHDGKLAFTDETGPEGIKGDFASTIELIFPIKIKV